MTPNKKEEEIFFFSTLYFYYRHTLHKILWDTLRDPRSHEGSPEQDTEWALAVLGKLPKKGKQISFFMDKLFANPKVSQYPWELDTTKLTKLLQSLEAMFNNQEFCAQCEAWSYFDIEEPQEFAVVVASEMLALRSVEGGLWGSTDKSTRVKWFEDIFNGQTRFDIVLEATRSMMTEFGATTLLLEG